MIKILILLIVFIFLVVLLNTYKNENFSNIMLRCGEISKPGKPGKPIKTINSNIDIEVDSNNQDVTLIRNIQDVVIADGSIVSNDEITKPDSSGTPIGVNTQIELENVDPNLPECVGICINQHTYTKENTKNIFLPSPKFLNTKKTNQQDEAIIRTGCGECINNFYHGLKLLKDKSDNCKINN